MVKLRTRECNNPVPESGGLNCTGSKVEQYPCGSPAECQCKSVYQLELLGSLTSLT